LKVNNLQIRLENAERALGERRGQETALLSKLESNLLDAAAELRKKDSLLEDLKANVGIDRDARRRIEVEAEVQRKELEKLREYRSTTLKLGNELDQRSREKANLESSLSYIRKDLDKCRAENVDLKTRLTRMNPIQTNLEIELDRCRGRESELKKEVAVLRAEIEQESQKNHELARDHLFSKQLSEKERNEVATLRLEANQLRSEISKLARDNQALEEKFAASLDSKEVRLEEFKRKEEIALEGKRVAEQKIYELKRQLTHDQFEKEKKQVEVRSTREELHRTQVRLQEVTDAARHTRQELDGELQDTKAKYDDKKKESDTLSSSLVDMENAKNYLTRRVKQLENELNNVVEEAGDLRTTTEMRMQELENNLELTERKADMYRLKNQELKDVMLKESADMLANKMAHSRLSTPAGKGRIGNSPRRNFGAYNSSHKIPGTPDIISPSSHE
jgi:chromosome segregation ATPase